MTTIADIREKYPQYDDLSDTQLADAFHKKFYADMPREEFDLKIGLSPAAKETQARLKGDEGEYTAFGQNFAEGVPVIGPWLKERYLDADAWLDTHLPTSMVGRDTTGQSWEEARKYSEDAGKSSEKYHPWASTAGELSGAAAGTGALMALPGGAAAFGARSIPGLSGIPAFAARVGLGTTTGATLGGVDAAARDEDVAQGAMTGGAFGAAGPVIGAAASPALQKVLSKLGVAPSRTGSKALYTAAKEFDEAVEGSKIPRIIEENFGRTKAPQSQKIQEYLNTNLSPLPINEDRVLAELNRIARNPGPGRDLIKEVYGDSVSLSKKEVNKLATDWFKAAPGDSQAVKSQKQFFHDKLIDFGSDHDKAYNFFSKQANQRKLDALSNNRGEEFLERLWSPAIVADANKGMQKSLNVGLNREAAAKVTKKAPVEIGGPQSVTNRAWNAFRRRLEASKDGRRPDIDKYLAELLLKDSATAGGKTFSAGTIIEEIHKSVKQGRLPNDEARRLIATVLQAKGTDKDSTPIVEKGILASLILGNITNRAGGAIVDIANPY
ncbi:hypothetical protein [Phyllobacterium sp. SB3]|uniref:hypothetical protein n=1 Tax=Phyllobacterium sp. SB3 TaxID=3156073 RepID=UPI0032AF1E4B